MRVLTLLALFITLGFAQEQDPLDFLKPHSNWLERTIDKLENPRFIGVGTHAEAMNWDMINSTVVSRYPIPAQKTRLGLLKHAIASDDKALQAILWAHEREIMKSDMQYAKDRYAEFGRRPDLSELNRAAYAKNIDLIDEWLAKNHPEAHPQTTPDSPASP